MKTFLILFTFSLSAFAQETFSEVAKVRSVDIEKDEATVTFWNKNKVYRMPANSKFIPCLQNGQKAQMEVLLTKVKNTDAISECKLYSDGK